jgi:hypothetical protein
VELFCFEIKFQTTYMLTKGMDKNEATR